MDSDKPSAKAGSIPTRNDQNENTAHSADDEPMNYSIPRDYATEALQERERLIADGVDPENIILMSEINNRFPQQENESCDDLAKRYAKLLKEGGANGKHFLGFFLSDYAPYDFSTPEGRYFNLGPGSGATKGEFREFQQWLSEALEQGRTSDVPEKWLKFETASRE